jgi:hypothetical protein
MNGLPTTPDAWIERNDYDPQPARDYDRPQPDEDLEEANDEN